MAINILIKKTGPYVLSGDLSQLEIADADGKKVDISGKQAIALCRCGASTNKPFCDGSHKYQDQNQPSESRVVSEKSQPEKSHPEEQK